MSSQTQRTRSTLVLGYVRGDSSALETVHRWIDVVLRGSFRSLAGDWDDLRQEARTRVFRNLRDGSFRADAELRTYVHQITRNVCIDHLRHATSESRRLKEAALRSVQDAPPASRHADRDLLEKLLAGLSREDRRLLGLVHLRCCSYAEVARELGISEGAVKLRMFRCRQRVLRRRRQLLRQQPGRSSP